MKQAAINLTVKEIAYKCGYSSEYSFMHQLKNHFGKTPTGFQKMIWEILHNRISEFATFLIEKYSQIMYTVIKELLGHTTL